MSLLFRILDGGLSTPARRTLGQRLTLGLGRWLALRHAHVQVPPSCMVHPEARIHPRTGTIRLGERCSIAAGAVVQGNVELGDDCSIQTGTILVGYGTRDDRAGLIRIGNGVRIAPMVMMIASNHRFDGDRPIRQQGMQHAPITIGDDVWIAGRVNVMAGVTIGRGCVVGAGAVVTKDIPPNSIAVGVPARVIASRTASRDAAVDAMY
ncbi:MAG TPA: acyltransferase [Tepidisphaeraceae bacterium]|nr:acyltransferase [Tepidisphaeraceae bacterium]